MIDLSALLAETAEHSAVVAAFPGLSADQRLQALTARSILILRDGEDVAVFQSRWLARWEALVLDIDDPRQFAWAALTYFFDATDAVEVEMSSGRRDAGFQFGASSGGVSLVTNHAKPWMWRLQRDDFSRFHEEYAQQDFPGTEIAPVMGG